VSKLIGWVRFTGLADDVQHGVLLEKRSLPGALVG
jgi:hypothetical protein